MCYRDRDRFSGVTNEDIQEKIEVLRGDVQHQLAEQARNVQHQFAEQARMLSEMRNLVLCLKEVKDKEEQEEATKKQADDLSSGNNGLCVV